MLITGRIRDKCHSDCIMTFLRLTAELISCGCTRGGCAKRHVSGAVFGPGFEPEDVELSPWGSLQLELDCSEGAASSAPVEPGSPA